jgi:hypothetical protein
MHSILASYKLKISTFTNINDLFEMRGCFSNVKGWDDSLNVFKKKHGFISTSGSWDNELLWAYYASNHKGVCLRLDVNGVVSEDGELITKISYIEKPKYFNNDKLCYIVDNPDSNSIKKDMLSIYCTKHKKWDHEKEYRLLAPLCGCMQDICIKCTEMTPQYVEFDAKVKLTGIYLGAKCNISISMLRKIIENFNTSNEYVISKQYNNIDIIRINASSKYGGMKEIIVDRVIN